MKDSVRDFFISHSPISISPIMKIQEAVIPVIGPFCGVLGALDL